MKVVRNDDKRRQKLDFYIILMNLENFLATMMRCQLARVLFTSVSF